MKRSISLMLMAAAWLTLIPLGYGQQPQPPKVQRTLYQLKHGSAASLAEVLGKHFQGEPGTRILAEPTSNGLLITATPAVLKEIVELVGQLDRRPRMVVLEVLIADVPVKKGEDGKPALPKELDPKEVTGAISKILAKLEAWQKQGTIGDLKRLQLTTVENRPTNLTIGGQMPYTTGSFASVGGGKGGKGGGGLAPSLSRSVNYRDGGSKVDVIARVEGDKVVTLDLKLEEKRMFTPEDGVAVGNDENGKAIRAMEFATTTLSSRLNVPSGEGVVAEGASTTSRSGQSQTLIIVTARILDGDGKGK